MKPFPLQQGWLDDSLLQSCQDFWNQEKYLATLDQLQQTLRQYSTPPLSDTSDREAIAHVEIAIATVYDQLEHPDLANRYYTSALPTLMRDAPTLGRFLQSANIIERSGEPPPKPPPPPKNAEAKTLFQRAHENYGRQNYHQSIDDYEKILALYADDLDVDALAVKARGLFSKGYVLELMGESDRAKKSYQQLLSLLQQGESNAVYVIRSLVNPSTPLS